MKKILIVGAGGQIGTELKIELRKLYGESNVIAADLQSDRNDDYSVQLDAMDASALSLIVNKFKIDAIYNLVALLSARGEKDPALAWKINMGALLNALEVARQYDCKVFTPSSIGAFGPDAPKDKTPQDTVMHPTTVYGICKVTGELMGNYYWERFGVDARSVRFPGLISNSSLPGGGTTDYAVDCFYSAVKGEKFICPIPRDRYMDMMYMPDAIDALHDLMVAPPRPLIHRNGYNVTAMSFCPEELFEAIKKRIPTFEWEYDIDPMKDKISDSWPNSLDDTCARQEWGWNPKWDRDAMIDDMIKVLSAKLL
ncbi:L-threonine 3-dehydrogenase [Mucinivorans hirudinis]|uniref:L-threonine 3-dehydrogenase n=1 Tax=Mucinivorans hirudinis TaxID=1433126 RepID=A0A060R7U6_9BACT|nr:L-threonine 3-dehydrogenase [Mucinivorans hirudinis]